MGRHWEEASSRVFSAWAQWQKSARCPIRAREVKHKFEWNLRGTGMPQAWHARWSVLGLSLSEALNGWTTGNPSWRPCNKAIVQNGAVAAWVFSVLQNPPFKQDEITHLPMLPRKHQFWQHLVHRVMQGHWLPCFFSNLAWAVRVSLALVPTLMSLSLQSSWSISVSIQWRSRVCILLFCHVVAPNRLVTSTGCQLFKQRWSDQLEIEDCKLFEGMFLGNIFNIILCAHFC